MPGAMPRYFTKSVYFDDGLEATIHHDYATVFEPDAVNTGVLDAHGQPIFKASLGPIGFDMTKAMKPPKKPAKPPKSVPQRDGLGKHARELEKRLK